MNATEPISSTAPGVATDVRLRKRHSGTKPDKAQFINDFTSMLAKKLNLTDEQLSKIRDILQENLPERGKKSQDPDSTSKNPPDSTKLNQMNEKIKSVLTDSQKTIFDSIIQDIRHNRHNHPAGPIPDPGSQNYSSTLFSNILGAIDHDGPQQVPDTDNDVDYYA